MTKKLIELTPLERLHRSYEAMGDVAQDESDSSRAKAAAKALSGVLQKAVSKGASHDVMVKLFAEEIGVSRRVASNALRPFFKSTKPEALPGVSEQGDPLPDTPTLSKKHKPEVHASSAIFAKSLPPLPGDLMPKDGQMPVMPKEGEYRIEHRSGGVQVYVMQGNTYSLLPGIDPAAPFGRYVDGRPMNEWGSPIGEGPPVIHGTHFIGENHQE
jgi:hypothetical protein